MKIRIAFALLLLGTTLLTAQLTPPDAATNAERMGQRLRHIYNNYDWKADPNKPAERARYYERLLKQLQSPRDRSTVALELASEQLHVGESEASIATLEGLATRTG